MTVTLDVAQRVVFVNRYFHPDLSATSQLLTDLASGLAKSGAEVHVICSRQRYDDAGVRLASHESFGAVSVHRVWTTRFGRRHLVGRALDYATFYLSSAIAMLQLLTRGDTVVAKTDPPLLSLVAMVAAKLKGAQLINWLQDVFPEVASRLGANPLPPLLDVWLRRCRNFSLRSARMNVVLGERMRDHLRRAGVPADQVAIIENWAELQPDPPKLSSNSSLRASLGLDDRFVVAYSGNLGRAHEYRTVLGAAEMLQGHPTILFLMVGGGVGMSQLQRDVCSRGLQQSFRFLDYQPREKLSDCLAAADVHWVSLRPSLEGLVVPSKYYGILAAGRPVIFIGDSDGELARDIRGGACGATVEMHDSARLAQLLTSWQADPALLLRLGASGYRHYCERFSAKRAFDQWLDILKSGSRAGVVSAPAPSNR
jgi:glycosyltransferase involved in cell wall biosynthesis